MCVCVHYIILNKRCSNKWLLRNKEVPLSASAHDFPSPTSAPSYVAAQASDGCRSHGRDQKGRTEESRSTCWARAWALGYTWMWYTPYIINLPIELAIKGHVLTSSPILGYTQLKDKIRLYWGWLDMVPFGCMLRSYGIDGPFLDDKKYDSPIIYIYSII